MKTKLQSLILIVVLCVLSINLSVAVPAYPKPITITQPDGSKLTITIKGDEFFHYKLTSDGYQVTQHSDGFYYYYSMEGESTKSAPRVRANEPNQRTAQELSYLKSVKKGVDAQYYSMGQLAANIKRQYRDNIAPMSRAASESSMNKTPNPVGEESIVILAQFSDVKFQSNHQQSDFENLLNQPGYSYGGAIGSVKDYFNDNSLGKFNPTFTVSPIATLPHERSYYGGNDSSGNDKKPAQMVLDACKAVNNDIDFSKFDSNGDGMVDNVFVIFAGHNEAEGAPSDCIWPHRWAVYPSNSTGSRMFDGVSVHDYACTSELKGANGNNFFGIGTFAHEFGHILGLPDFYDCDYADGGGSFSEGLYNISIMSSGNYNGGGDVPPYYSVLEREILDWNTPQNLANSPHKITLEPNHTEEGNNGYYMETGNNGEIFMFESRKAVKWDEPLGESGLLIYHIDRSTNNVNGATAISRWSSNSLNNDPRHPCARLIQSSGPSAGYYLNNIYYPGKKNNTSFKSGSYGFSSWSGKELPVQILEISNNNGTVSITTDVEIPSGEIAGKVVNADGDIISGAKITMVYTLDPSVKYSFTTSSQGEYSSSEVREGVYTLTCTAQGYLSHSAEVEIEESTRLNYNVELKSAQKLNISGVVRNQENTKLSNVNVVFELISTEYSSAAQKTKTANSGKIEAIALQQSGVVATKANVSPMQKAVLSHYDAMTNSAGSYAIENIQLGTYSVSFSLDGYAPYYIDNFVMDGSQTTMDATLQKLTTELMTYFSWADQQPQSYLSIGTEEDYMVAAQWSEQELGAMINQNLDAVSIKVQSGSTGNIQARVILNGVEVANQTQSINSGSEILTFSVASKPFISSNSELRVEFSVPGTVSALLDGGPAASGRGNLFSADGVKWETLEDYNISYNPIISLLHNKGTDTPDAPIAEIRGFDQRSFTLYFISSDANIENWTIRYKAKSSSDWSSYETRTPATVLVSDLEPGTAYDVEVIAEFNGQSAKSSLEVTTLAATAPFAAMSGIKYIYNVRDTYECKVTNLADSFTTIRWYLDGNEVDAQKGITFTQGAASHTIKCVITYSDGRVETILRKVLVN